MQSTISYSSSISCIHLDSVWMISCVSTDCHTSNATAGECNQRCMLFIAFLLVQIDHLREKEGEVYQVQWNEWILHSIHPSIHSSIHAINPIHYHLMHAVSLYAWSPLCRHLHRRLWAPIEAQHVWASTLWSSCDLPRLGLSVAVRWIDRRYNECRGCLMITMIRVDHENNCGSDNCDDNDDDDCGSINN